MLAVGQVKEVAQELGRTADGRFHYAGDRSDRQRLWEAVRHACHAIEAVAELEELALSVAERGRCACSVVAELEPAPEAARRAQLVLGRGSGRGEGPGGG